MPGQTVAPLCPALLRQSGGGIGAFVPQCEGDGSFSTVQCWGSTGYCWCVESTSGRPISEGVRGQPDCPGQHFEHAEYVYFCTFYIIGAKTMVKIATMANGNSCEKPP